MAYLVFKVYRVQGLRCRALLGITDLRKIRFTVGSPQVMGLLLAALAETVRTWAFKV